MFDSLYILPQLIVFSTLDFLHQRRDLSKSNEGDALNDEYRDVPEQPEYCIDAGSCGSVARYINHSCEPNLFVQCVLNDHHDLSRPHIWFCAADTIHPLEVCLSLIIVS